MRAIRTAAIFLVALGACSSGAGGNVEAGQTGGAAGAATGGSAGTAATGGLSGGAGATATGGSAGNGAAGTGGAVGTGGTSANGGASGAAASGAAGAAAGSGGAAGQPVEAGAPDASLTDAAIGADGGAKTTAFTLTYAAAPADNPLKGFMPYDGSYATFPHSLEWFYLPLKDLQSDYTTFTWGPLDTKLAQIAGRGHQAVFRIYLDYPGEPYGVPAFLSAVPKQVYTDNGNTTSFSPDYENADLRRALKSFIAALGAHCDGKPEVAFITLGLLGFWGEWHTYPHPWMASTTVMTEVLDAFQAAFPTTHLLAREPKAGVGMDRPRLGFHDDSFAYSSIGTTSWYAWPLIVAAGLGDAWKTRCMGGEVRPEVQPCLWDATSCAPAGQEFNACVDTTHSTWMLNQAAFSPGFTGDAKTRAIAGAERLGYELFVADAKIATSPGGDVTVNVTVRNRGVAPFYYPWVVEIAVKGPGGTTAWPTTWDLRTVLPGADAAWTFTKTGAALAKGSSVLMMRVVNPLANGKPLRFANATQDADVTGWLTLGAFNN